MSKKQPIIQVQNISKMFRIPHEAVSTIAGHFVKMFKNTTYEEFQVLSDCSFEIFPGEFVGIIGKNGSGKSTLLKMLAGIYFPDTGKIHMHGEISPFLELGIGFHPELSGRDNIYLNGALLGMSTKEIDENYHEIVAFSELERFIDQKLKNYSSGMQVRLAFSVAIHAKREILLMDEVLAVGDANFQAKCLEKFFEMRKEGKTIILVTHDIGIVERYCDRAIYLQEGKIIHQGYVRDVVKEYQQQNVEDAEKIEAQKEQEKSVVSNKQANDEQEQRVEIVEVEFFDSTGASKHVFQTHEDIIARIHYDAHEYIPSPVFGVALYTMDDIHLCGPNTRSSHVDISHIQGKGYVDFIMKDNKLFSNTYSLTVAIFDEKIQIPLVFKDKSYTFKVMSQEQNQYGLFQIEHTWKMKK